MSAEAARSRPDDNLTVPDAATVLKRAEAALAKIDLWGLRGITGLSIEEIEAMALVLAATDGIARLRAATKTPVTETTKG